MIESKTLLIGLVIGLLLGAGVCISLVPKPDISSYEDQIAELNNQIATLQRKFEELRSKTLKLHISGRNIVDDYGHIVQLRGCVRQYPRLTWPEPRDDEAYFDLIKDSGANCFEPYIMMDYYQNDIKYADMIRRVIRWCQEREIYVIIGLFPTESATDIQKLNLLRNPEPLYEFWEHRAIEWSEGVGFNIMIEPIREGTDGLSLEECQDLWATIALEACRRIHAVNPNILCFIDSIPFSVTDMWQQRGPLPEPNIVYAVHFYYHNHIISGVDYAVTYAAGNLTEGLEKMEQFIDDRVLKLREDYNVPILFEEFGAWRADPQFGRQADPFYIEQYKDFLDVLEDRDANWTQLGLQGRFLDRSVNLAMLTEDWSTLNEVGSIWQEHLLKES